MNSLTPFNFETATVQQLKERIELLTSRLRRSAEAIEGIRSSIKGGYPIDICVMCDLPFPEQQTTFRFCQSLGCEDQCNSSGASNMIIYCNRCLDLHKGELVGCPNPQCKSKIKILPYSSGEDCNLPSEEDSERPRWILNEYYECCVCGSEFSDRDKVSINYCKSKTCNRKGQVDGLQVCESCYDNDPDRRMRCPNSVCKRNVHLVFRKE